MGIQLANPERAAIEVMAEVINPPPPIDYERWAIDNIVFSKRESPAFPGPYNPRLFPFYSEILRALGPDEPCRSVTFKKSAQIGATVLAQIFCLGSVAMDPGDFMFTHPTEDNASRWSKQKLKTMLRSTTSLRNIFADKARDGGDSVLYKERVDGRGAITISGANSPASLSMITVPRQVQDDLAKWVTNPAGDPERQANSRSRGVEFAKIFKPSTPLIMPGCRITTNFERGTQEHYHVPCPHCGHMHRLEWENMLADLDDDHPENAHFTCPECGCEIHEHHRPAMVAGGTWIAENPKAAREHRSFYLWSAYSPLQSWERIAREWLDAKGDPAQEQVFANDTVGEPYRTKGEAPPWEALRDRAEGSTSPRGVIPAGFPLLTMGIDCQKDRVEWQLVAQGREFRRAVVEYGVVPGHISEAPTQKLLDDLVAAAWPNVAGNRVCADRVAIDGNAWTEDVWQWARRHLASKVIMVRGVGSEAAPLLSRVKKERSHSGKVLKYQRRFYNFGTSVLKMATYRNAAKTDLLERGFIAFARGLGDQYFQQFTAERRVAVKRKDGFTAYRWEKDPGQANEALDTFLQAEAAAISLGVRVMTEAGWDRLEHERETPPADVQLDLEDIAAPGAAAMAVAPVNAAGTAKQPGRRVRRSFQVRG